MRPSKAVRDSVRPFRRWLPWTFLALPVLIAAQSIEWDRRTRATFREQAEQVKADIARLRSRDRRRPAFIEPTVPGNAWERHQAAFKAVEAIVRKPIARPTAPTPAETAWLRATYAPILPLFEEALARETIDLDLEYEKGLRGERGLRDVFTLMVDIGALARGLHEAGEDAEALRALVTTLGVMNDLRYERSARAVRTSLSAEYGLLDACKDVLSGHSLGAPDLERLAGALDRLVAVRYDVHAAVESEFVLRRQTVLRDESSEEDPYFQWERSWRNVFQVGMARAAGLRQMSLAQEEVAALRALPLQQWSKEVSRLARQRRFRSIGPTFEEVRGAVYQELYTRDRLELFRAAVALARYREETGKEAAYPELLVPRYLPSLPVSPWTGEELLCREGWVGFTEDAKSGWIVRRGDDAALSAQR